ncbi:MAG: hypothetical protein MAG795_00495 [Candidatus Woesearchaeota archaeon]|nr:hypothetical protein [Candidatus Woesearchaeota archaeon]
MVPELKRMVQVFLDHNLVLTLGVVTQKPGKQEIWDYYKYLQNQGIEISSHTVNHYNLPVLRQAELEYEIEESYNLICQNTIKCPYTIILPFGNGRHDSRVVQAAGNIGYFGIVSIAGENYFGGNTPHTFRRIPPDFSSQARTLNLLKNSFGDK